MYNLSMKKAWYIEGYTFKGQVLCRECVSETLDSETFLDPYTNDEHEQFAPIFTSDLDEELECDYCWKEIG